MASIFSGIEDTKILQASRKLNPDHNYVVSINRVSQTTSGQTGGIMVPVEFEIVESDDPNLVAGATASWVPKMSQGRSFLPNLAAFALCVIGVDPADKDSLDSFQSVDMKDPKRRSHLQILLDDAVSDKNTFQGRKVGVFTKGTTTKAGHPFVVHTFFPVED